MIKSYILGLLLSNLLMVLATIISRKFNFHNGFIDIFLIVICLCSSFFIKEIRAQRIAINMLFALLSSILLSATLFSVVLMYGYSL